MFRPPMLMIVMCSYSGQRSAVLCKSRNGMIRTTCGKTLRDGILNGLMRDRTGVEDIENHLGETWLRWLGQLERIGETNLVKKVREERVPGHTKRGRPKKIMGWGGETRYGKERRVHQWCPR